MRCAIWFMQNKKKRSVLSKPAVVTAASILGIACVTGGTIAYFVNMQNAVNTQTIGKVSIKTIEPNFPTDDSDENGVPDACEKLTAYSEVEKDPMITNTGVNDAVVFLKVTSPVELVNLISEDDSGKATVSKDIYTDLYWFKQKDDSVDLHQNHFNEDWVFLKDASSVKDPSDTSTATVVKNVCTTNSSEVVTTNNERTGYTYVFGYRTRIAAGESTSTLFDKIQNKKYSSTNIQTDENENIIVESYAIQADSILKADSQTEGHVVNSTGDISEDDLAYIYNTYINQNPAD